MELKAQNTKMNFDASKFKNELYSLLAKYKAALGVDIQGDTHGISENFIVIDSDGNEEILAHYKSIIDASDIKRIRRENSTTIKKDILKIVDKKSGGIKFTELVAEMAERNPKGYNPDELLELIDKIPELGKLEYVMDQIPELGKLEYVDLGAGMERVKYFVYRRPKGDAGITA